jgi:undecaprenyl-diphosphatase
MFLREEQKDRWFFIQFVLAACISFLSVEILLKPIVGRLRPFTELVAVVVGQASNGFSFPSGHATFAFALAAVLARKEPRYASWLYMLAIAVSFTRIYLGQHYPLDVIAGGLLGWVIGILAIAGSNRIRTYLQLKAKRSQLS